MSYDSSDKKTNEIGDSVDQENSNNRKHNSKFFEYSMWLLTMFFIIIYNRATRSQLLYATGGIGKLGIIEGRYRVMKDFKYADSTSYGRVVFQEAYFFNLLFGPETPEELANFFIETFKNPNDVSGKFPMEWPFPYYFTYYDKIAEFHKYLIDNKNQSTYKEEEIMAIEKSIVGGIGEYRLWLDWYNIYRPKLFRALEHNFPDYFGNRDFYEKVAKYGTDNGDGKYISIDQLASLHSFENYKEKFTRSDLKKLMASWLATRFEYQSRHAIQLFSVNNINMKFPKITRPGSMAILVPLITSSLPLITFSLTDYGADFFEKAEKYTNDLIKSDSYVGKIVGDISNFFIGK